MQRAKYVNVTKTFSNGHKIPTFVLMHKLAQKILQQNAAFFGSLMFSNASCILLKLCEVSREEYIGDYEKTLYITAITMSIPPIN